MVVFSDLPSEILVLGPGTGDPAKFSMEYYCPVNPEVNRPSETSKTGRKGHTSVLMPGGRILIAGGQGKASTEIF